MKILYHTWNALGGYETVDYFKQAGYEYKCIFYQVKNVLQKSHNPEFEEILHTELNQDSYDCVFSWNYFPLDARVCHDHGIPYIAWVYDYPLYCGDISLTLPFDTNYAFFFDRNQAREMRQISPSTSFYLPLPTDITRRHRFQLTAQDRKKYSSEVSFVGQLYPNALNFFRNPLSDSEKGFLDGVLDAQTKVYGQYFIPDIITPAYLTRVNAQIFGVTDKHRVSIEKLLGAIPRYITSRERLLLLALLSKEHQVTVYCKERHEALTHVQFAETVSNVSEAPLVFKASKINLNVTLKSISSGIPLRILDIMSCAGMVLSNYQPEFPDYFKQWKDIVWYESIIDAKEKTDYLLKHEAECKQIGINGYQNVCKNFSFKILFDQIFNTVFHNSDSCRIF